jgi:hypothetical protein
MGSCFFYFATPLQCFIFIYFRTRKRVNFSSSSEVSRKQPRRNGGEAQKQPRSRTRGAKQANSGDPQASTSAVSNVKHEDEDEEELPDINTEESDGTNDDDADHNLTVESNAMRMNVASALTCTPSVSSSARAGLKDAAGMINQCKFCRFSDFLQKYLFQCKLIAKVTPTDLKISKSKHT